MTSRYCVEVRKTIKNAMSHSYGDQYKRYLYKKSIPVPTKYYRYNNSPKTLCVIKGLRYRRMLRVYYSALWTIWCEQQNIQWYGKFPHSPPQKKWQQYVQDLSYYKNITLLRHLQCSAVQKLQDHKTYCDVDKTKECHTLVCTSMHRYAPQFFAVQNLLN